MPAIKERDEVEGCPATKEYTADGPEGEFEVTAHCLLDRGHDGPHRDVHIEWHG